MEHTEQRREEASALRLGKRRKRPLLLLALMMGVLGATYAGEPQMLLAAPRLAGHSSPVAPLHPASGQRVPHSLLDANPIPAVWAAAVNARADRPVPLQLSPASPIQNNPAVYVPFRCVPQFGPGSSFDVCPLGDTRSRRVVALLGDSHAWMWIPGLTLVAQALHFRLVPLTKPGCLISVVHENRRGWPCLTWYRRALRTIRALRPAATIVSFMTSTFAAVQAVWVADALQRVLRAVPHGILIADPPEYNWNTGEATTPETCLSSPGANQGTCARQEAPQMRASLAAIQTMAARDRFPTVPTLQWFCADLICPTVIDGTVTSEDGSHITAQYSKLLAPLMADELRPTLAGIWRRQAQL